MAKRKQKNTETQNNVNRTQQSQQNQNSWNTNNQQGYNQQNQNSWNTNNQQGYNQQNDFTRQGGNGGYNNFNGNRNGGMQPPPNQPYNRGQVPNQGTQNQVPRRNTQNEESKKPSFLIPAIIIGVVILVIIVIGFIMYSGNQQAQQQQLAQQQAQKQAQQQAQQESNRKRVMEFQTFNEKTDGFIPTKDLMESLNGTPVPTSDTIDETSVKSGYVSFVKGRVMISPGMMLCYIIANYNGKNYFQQVPYSTWEQLPEKGTTLVELESDQDNSGNNFISFMQVKTNLQSIVAKINQEQAQQELNNKLKKQQQQEEQEIKELNKQLSQQN